MPAGFGQPFPNSYRARLAVRLLDAQDVGAYWWNDDDSGSAQAQDQAREWAAFDQSDSLDAIMKDRQADKAPWRDEGPRDPLYSPSVSVVLVGTSRVVPDDFGSALASKRDIVIPLKEIQYNAGKGWHTISAAGHSVRVPGRGAADTSLSDAPHPFALYRLAGDRPLTPEDRSDIARRAWDTRGRSSDYSEAPAVTTAVTATADPALTAALMGDVRSDKTDARGYDKLMYVGEKERMRVKAEVDAKLDARLATNAAFRALLKAGGDVALRQFVDSGIQRDYAKRSLSAVLIHQWAETSADDNALSIAIQLAAQQEFHLNAATTSHLAQVAASQREVGAGPMTRSSYRDAQELLNQYGDGLRAFVRAQYDETQAFFRMYGISEVTVYRGVHSVHGQAGELFAKHQQSLEREPQAIPIDLQPISSFTLNPTTAGQIFGTKMIFAMKVPVSRVLSTFRTGIGALTESEVTVLGGRYLALGAAAYHDDPFYPTSRTYPSPQAFEAAGKKAALR